MKRNLQTSCLTCKPWFGGFLTLLLILLAQPSLLIAAEQQKTVPPVGDEPGFIFSEVTPSQLAVLCLGVSVNPSSGGLPALMILNAGEDRRLQLWTMEDPFLTSPFKIPFGVGRLVLSGTPIALPQSGMFAFLNSLAWLAIGDSRTFDFWTLVDTTRVRSIDPLLLDRIRDDQPIPSPQSFSLEIDAWFTMVILAGQTDVDAFEKATNRDLTYSQMWQRPRRYRGEVATLEGKLRQIDRIESPQILQQAGFPHVYEGWLFLKNHADNPVCILFTRLPEGIQPGRQMEHEVRFSGYFYKKYRYPDAQRKDRTAPLVIGRTPVLLQGEKLEADSAPGWVKEILPVFLTLIAVGAGLALVMAIWFRHHDNRIRAKISRARNQTFVLPGDAEMTVSSPANETIPGLKASQFENVSDELTKFP